MNEQKDNYAPWGTRGRMRVMAVLGPLLSVACVILGLMWSRPLLVLGAAMLLFWVVALLLAAKRKNI